MSDDLKLYTLQQSQQKLDEISSILQQRFGDKWKTIIFICGLFLFFVVLLIIFGLDFSESPIKDLLNHGKAFLIVLFLGIGFFCVWASILPDDSSKIYGIIPFPTMNAIIPVDSTQCGINPTLCDSNSGCSVCVDSNGVNNYDCILIPKDKNNIYYLGTPLQAGKSYCLPKAEQLRPMLNPGGCGTYTGKIVYGSGNDNVQGWRCQCLYPDLYGDPGQGCLKPVACQNGGHLVDQTDGKTIWDPTNMPSSLIGVSPYEKMKDGSPRFRCQCGSGYYNLPEDPYVCHPNLCYAGSSAEATVFNAQTRQCECNPANNVIKSNVSGFCYPVDNNCNPDPSTGGCRYGITIPDGQRLIFRKGDKCYLSDTQSFVDVTSNVNTLGMDKNKIVNLDNTILKDAFYAFPISTNFSAGNDKINGILQGFNSDSNSYTNMVTLLTSIATKATTATSPGIARLCNSFFYKHDNTTQECLNQLSKTGSESFPNFGGDLSLIDCGKDDKGSSIGTAQVDIFNLTRGYNCQCSYGKSYQDGDTCITCLQEGEKDPLILDKDGNNIGYTKCCSNNTKYIQDVGGNTITVCDSMASCKGGSRTKGGFEVCSDVGNDCECKDGMRCANNRNGNQNGYACCPYGASSSFGFGTWCINLNSGDLCQHNFQCKSDSCDAFHCK